MGRAVGLKRTPGTDVDVLTAIALSERSPDAVRSDESQDRECAFPEAEGGAPDHRRGIEGKHVCRGGDPVGKPHRNPYSRPECGRGRRVGDGCWEVRIHSLTVNAIEDRPHA
jgi:hypothetical protein